jgi:hypothetical protein
MRNLTAEIRTFIASVAEELNDPGSGTPTT